MAPLANARTIPLGWSAHHAPVAEGAMNGRVSIFDPARYTEGWDEVSESKTRITGPPMYAGPARIEPALSAREVVQADDAEQYRSYLIQITFDAPELDEEWDVVVDEAHNDPQLVGALMTITDVQLGTERFTRDLVCTHRGH